MADIILADRQGSGRKGKKNGQMEKYDGPPKDLGSWGDLPRTCRFIEAHDPRNKGKVAGHKPAVIDYLPASAKWPKGCYKGKAPKAETVYMTPEEVIDLAREMGMTAEEAGNEWRSISSRVINTPATAGPAPKDSEESDGPQNNSPSMSSSGRARTGRGTRASGKGAAGPVGRNSTRSTGERPGSPAGRSARGSRATKTRSPTKRR